MNILIGFTSQIKSSDTFTAPLSTILPQEIFHLAIDKQTVSVRVWNVLERQNIKTIGDLAQYSIMEILKWPNFGRTSLNVLVDALAAIIESNEQNKSNDHLIVSIETIEEVSENTSQRRPSSQAEATFKEIVDHSLIKIPSRNRNILLARLGFFGKEKTLEELGEQYGITRERIRQIEAKSLRTLRLEAQLDEVLVTRLQHLISNRAAPLLLDRLPKEDSWFYGFGDAYKFLGNLISVLTKGKYHAAEIRGLEIVSALSTGDWKDLVRVIQRLARAASEQKWPAHDFNLIVQCMLMQRRAPELYSLLQDTLSDRVHIARDGVKDVIVAYGTGLDHMIIAVLSESDRPLHYREIQQRIVNKYNTQADVRQVRNRVANTAAFMFSLGTYGLAKHLKLNNESLQQVKDHVESTLVSDPLNRQWHSVEITDMIMDRFPEMAGEIDQYVINYVLSMSEKLNYLGRNIWVAKAGETISSTVRIETNEAFVAILRDAGHPLTSDELMNRLAMRRGVSSACQIKPNDRMVCVRPGMWGLIGRDVQLIGGTSSVCLNRLFQLLNTEERGLDLIDLDSILQKSDVSWGQNVTPSVLLSLASCDARFGVAVGQILYLREWGNIRYKRLRHYVEDAIESINLPVPIEKILDRVRETYPREVSREQIYGCLRDMNLMFDESLQKWRRVELDLL